MDNGLTLCESSGEKKVSGRFTVCHLRSPGRVRRNQKTNDTKKGR